MKGKALQWLSQREHSRVELRRKLLRHATAERQAVELSEEHDGHDPATRVEVVLDWLEAHRYLSDERFIESRVHVRAGKFGNLRIRQELSSHQLVLPAPVAQALAEDEFARASVVRERKFSAWPVHAAERAKQARFLAGRGFSPDVIGRLLRRRHDDEAFAGDGEEGRAATR